MYRGMSSQIGGGIKSSWRDGGSFVEASLDPPFYMRQALLNIAQALLNPVDTCIQTPP